MVCGVGRAAAGMGSLSSLPPRRYDDHRSRSRPPAAMQAVAGPGGERVDTLIYKYQDDDDRDAVQERADMLAVALSAARGSAGRPQASISVRCCVWPDELTPNLAEFRSALAELTRTIIVRVLVKIGRFAVCPLCAPLVPKAPQGGLRALRLRPSRFRDSSENRSFRKVARIWPLGHRLVSERGGAERCPIVMARRDGSECGTPGPSSVLGALNFLEFRRACQADKSEIPRPLDHV